MPLLLLDEFPRLLDSRNDGPPVLARMRRIPTSFGMGPTSGYARDATR
jgi:hypothetical protein